MRDLAGRVWEWTGDYYAEGYDAQSTTDPTGPAEGTHRVQRGGGWASAEPLEFRAAARTAVHPALELHDVGMRCVWVPDG